MPTQHGGGSSTTSTSHFAECIRGGLDLPQLAKLVQRPLVDVAAAQEILCHIRAGVPSPEQLAITKPREIQSDAAAQLASSCAAAALQCAGWLVAARNVNAAVKEAGFDLDLAVYKCLVFASWVLTRAEGAAEFKLLRAALQPAAKAKAPGEQRVAVSISQTSIGPAMHQGPLALQ
jgi:hypothetical protein